MHVYVPVREVEKVKISSIGTTGWRTKGISNADGALSYVV